MASYWIVVPRGNAELFDLLSVAFRGRTGFSVIVDRRTTESHPEREDRRSRGVELGPDEFIVAERLATRQEDRQSNKRGSKRQRRAGPSSYRTESGRRYTRTVEPLPMRRDQRLSIL